MNKSDVELLRSLWVPLTYIDDEDCRQTLKSWLSDGNYYLNHAPPDLSLFCQANDELKKCLSLDAFRFSSHAAQTVHEMENTGAYEKLTSWRVIQSYYAAYFSAHALLRFFGRSFSHLEAGHVNFLKSRCASEAGYTPNLPSSYYLVSFDPSARCLSFEKYDESHKDLWKCFLKLIEDLELLALSARASTERQQELSNFFKDISDALTNRGKYLSGNWLSFVRNEVNYKSFAGVWFPFSRATPDFSELIGKVRGWASGEAVIKSPSLERNELQRFFITAFSVVDLAISVSLDYQSLNDRSGRRGQSFSRLVRLSARG